jgi:hypothetical protein
LQLFVAPRPPKREAPPFGLLQVAETIGGADWQPARITFSEALAELIDQVPKAGAGCMKSSMTCRIMARRDAAGVRLLTRNGRDFAGRFPMAAAAVATLPARSCLIA